MTAAPPATAPDSSLVVQGRLEEKSDGRIVLSLPGTDYRLHLQIDGPIETDTGSRLAGRIFARALRVDRVRTGGRFIEPVFGRPRRLQGHIVALDPTANTLTVRCPCPITCELTAHQRAGQFSTGQLVSFDIQSGARIVPLFANR